MQPIELSVCVPKTIVKTLDFPSFDPDFRLAFQNATGIEERRLGHLSASELCIEAAKKLQSFDPQEIGALIFVTQTPDRLMPGTSFRIAKKLGLSQRTICLDVNRACDGYVFGNYLADNLSNHGKKTLLLVGDTLHKIVGDRNKTMSLMFGDAGSATLLAGGSNRKFFSIQNGDGFNDLYADKNVCFMDGERVSAAALSMARNIIEDFESPRVSPSRHPTLFCHQANLQILKRIANWTRRELGSEYMPTSIKHFGNCSSVSIPVTIAQNKARGFYGSILGFGAGWSAVGCPDFWIPEVVIWSDV